MSPVAALIKSLDLVVLVNLAIMLCLFARPLYKGLRYEPSRFGVKLLCGIMWSHHGSFMFFGPLAYEFWIENDDPMNSLVWWPFRIYYLIAVLLGSTVHIAAWFAGTKSSWPIFPIWLTSCLAAVAVLTVLLVRGIL